MKVLPIQSGAMNPESYQPIKVPTPLGDDRVECKEISGVYYPLCNVSFGIANASKLKTLFKYGLPCMYSGVEMIDGKEIQKLMKAGVFNRPVSEAIKILRHFEGSLEGIEKKVYERIKEQSEIEPNKNIQETLQTISPIYERRLQKKIAPIFKDLKEASHDLPKNYKMAFDKLMLTTKAQLDGKPINATFNVLDFKYKLSKIKEDLKNKEDHCSTRAINKLITISDQLSENTMTQSLVRQKRLVSMIKTEFEHSVLKDNEQIKTLIDTVQGSLNREKVIIPFKRKAFLYSLADILKDVHDTKLQEKLLSIASELPTSKTSVSAYIAKFANEPSEKIAYRILWPFFASIEHIHPRSQGGADCMANFGGATTRTNSERQSIEFTKQIKRCPKTKIYCQKYVDKLIELAKEGVFNRYNIDIKYIEDFKKTIQKESNGAIVLDTSKLYK